MSGTPMKGTKRRWAKRIALAFAILVGNAWLYTKLFWPSTVTDAPEILANLYAKELCTCRFVVGQELERCFEQHRNIMLPSELRFDEAGKRVFVRVLWAHAEARVVSERHGCLREDPVYAAGAGK